MPGEETPLLSNEHPDTDDSGLTRVPSDRGCFSATKSDGSPRTRQELAEKLHAAGKLIAAQLADCSTVSTPAFVVKKGGFMAWSK